MTTIKIHMAINGILLAQKSSIFSLTNLSDGTERTLSTFADGTGLGGALDTPDGRAAT